MSVQANGEKVGGFCRIESHSIPLPDPQTIQIKKNQIICPSGTHICQIDFSQPDLTPETLVFIDKPGSQDCRRH